MVASKDCQMTTADEIMPDENAEIKAAAPKEIWLQLEYGDEGTHTWCDHSTGWEPEVKYTRTDTIPARVPEWQPIETAPKDGTWILVISDSYSGPVTAYWEKDGWFSEYAECNGVRFWMPLPAAPKKE